MRHVVTEGHSDADVIRAALGASPDIRIVAAGGRSSADSLARSILATRHEPVALVVDADAHRAADVDEQRRFFESSLEQVAERRLWHVALFVPEMEAVFFAQPSLLKKLVGRVPTAQEAAEARFEPKRVLLEMGKARSTEELLRLKPGLDLSSLRKFEPLMELVRFLEPAGAGAGRPRGKRERKRAVA